MVYWDSVLQPQFHILGSVLHSVFSTSIPEDWFSMCPGSYLRKPQCNLCLLCFYIHNGSTLKLWDLYPPFLVSHRRLCCRITAQISICQTQLLWICIGFHGCLESTPKRTAIEIEKANFPPLYTCYADLTREMNVLFKNLFPRQFLFL